MTHPVWDWVLIRMLACCVEYHQDLIIKGFAIADMVPKGVGMATGPKEGVSRTEQEQPLEVKRGKSCRRGTEHRKHIM